jgi:hypothetical protein
MYLKLGVSGRIAPGFSSAYAHVMGEARSVLLKWFPTWAHNPEKRDFTGRLDSDPKMFARIYEVYEGESHPDKGVPWYWTVSGTNHIASGFAPDAASAARAAVEAYKTWRDKQ